MKSTINAAKERNTCEKMNTEDIIRSECAQLGWLCFFITYDTLVGGGYCRRERAGTGWKERRRKFSLFEIPQFRKLILFGFGFGILGHKINKLRKEKKNSVVGPTCSGYSCNDFKAMVHCKRLLCLLCGFFTF